MRVSFMYKIVQKFHMFYQNPCCTMNSQTTVYAFKTQWSITWSTQQYIPISRFIITYLPWQHHHHHIHSHTYLFSCLLSICRPLSAVNWQTWSMTMAGVEFFLVIIPKHLAAITLGRPLPFSLTPPSSSPTSPPFCAAVFPFHQVASFLPSNLGFSFFFAPEKQR